MQSPQMQTLGSGVGVAGAERRRGARPRRRAPGFLSPAMLNPAGGRRHPGRRAGDWEQPYVDWYATGRVAAAAAVLLLACVDAYLSLRLWQQDAITLSPVMAMLMRSGFGLYAFVKVAVTALGVGLFLVFSHFRFYRLFRVYHLLYGLLAVYLAVVAGQLYTLASLA